MNYRGDEINYHGYITPLENRIEPGIKHDYGKPRYDLIPPIPLETIARVLTFGAEKYSDDNWRKPGLTYRRYFSAAMRHLWAWWRKEDTDPETGLNHLAHAACCILFLMQYQEEGTEGRDDR